MADKLRYVTLSTGTVQVDDVESMHACSTDIDGTAKLSYTKGLVKQYNTTNDNYETHLDLKTSTAITPTVTTSPSDDHVDILDTISMDETTHTLTFGMTMYKTGDSYTVDCE